MKIVAFDFDGVIRNSTEAIIIVTKNFLAQKGLPEIPENEYNNFNIVTGGKWREDVYKYLKVEEDPELDFKDYYTREFAKQPTRVYDGIIEAIAAVKNAGYKICLITNNSTARIKDKLAPTGLDFDFIRSCHGDISKPNPEYIFEVLNHFNCKPSDIIYIGDLYADYEFAKQTGMNFIWSAYGLDSGKMASIHGIHKVEKPSEIPDMIRKLDIPKEVVR